MNDEEQCVVFTSLKVGPQRTVTALFTCQIQGRFPTGTQEQHRAEPRAAGPPVSRSVLPSHFPKPGLWPEGTLAVSLPSARGVVCDF